MRIRFIPILTIAVSAVFSSALWADITVDQYLSVRRQYQANSTPIAEIKKNPTGYRGRVIEIRGTFSGIARSNDKTTIIIDADSGSYVISATGVPEYPSGSKVCALVYIGANSTISLSDLKLVSIIYTCRVEDREREAIAAAAAEKAKRLTAQKEKELAAKQAQKAATAPKSATQQNAASVGQMVDAYKKAIKSFNPKLADNDADTIARSIIAFSTQYKVDPRLVVAVILAESRFRPQATSPKGAMGLGQLMPGTAAGLGVANAYDPVSNVKGSVRLIKGHLDRLTGKSDWSNLTWHDLSLALASYNAGPGAVRKYGGVPPYRETQAYIKKVIYYYKCLCGQK